jgi:hypothetical protein
MSSDLVVPTIWGNHLRVRQAYDHDGEIFGAGVDFLESDGRSIRDMESLTRLDALRAGMALVERATSGLDSDASIALCAEAMAAFPGETVSLSLTWDNIIPFPASSEMPPPKTISEEDPTGGTPVHPVPPVGIVEESGVRSLESGEFASEGPAL